MQLHDINEEMEDLLRHGISKFSRQANMRWVVMKKAAKISQSLLRNDKNVVETSVAHPELISEVRIAFLAGCSEQ